MRILATFWRFELLWLALLTVLFSVLGGVSGSGAGPLERLPAWFASALLLAAYPAGLASHSVVFAERGHLQRRLGLFLLAAVSVSLVAFVQANWVGPALLSGGAGDGALDPASLTLGQLRTAIRAVRPPAETSIGSLELWLPYNRLAFHYVQRMEGMLVPALLAWVGVGVGFWSGRVPARSWRRAIQWGVGAFVVVSTYFATENGYELIVLRAAGPAEFAGDLILIVPGTLLLALGLATGAALLGSGDGTG